MTDTLPTLSRLGPASVKGDELLDLVSDQLGGSVSRVLSCSVERVDYDVPAITTAARWWVRGQAETPRGPTPYAFFVKVVQAWTRSPLFDGVPPQLREIAATGFPWRTEAAVYRSDLAERLPAGLRAPRVYAVRDLDDESYAVWLEAVDTVATPWTTGRFTRAARLLGRLAASPAVAPLALVGGFPFRARTYVETRLAMQVVPILRSDVWEHPGLAAYDPELRKRVLASLDLLGAYADEADTAPSLTTHGDAAPGNLLVTAQDPEGFVLIDYGLWNAMPAGFDLGQLLVGDVMIGRRPAARLAATEDVIVPAYVEGLHAEGCDLDERLVRRTHALLTYLFNGVSALPFELLDSPPAQLRAAAAERAALTRFSLDLIDATA